MLLKFQKLEDLFVKKVETRFKYWNTVVPNLGYVYPRGNQGLHHI